MKKQRSRSWRRFQNDKIIRKRLGYVKIFNAASGMGKISEYNPEPGTLRKWNFTCGCRMCKLSGYYDSKEKINRQVSCFP